MLRQKITSNISRSQELQKGLLYKTNYCSTSLPNKRTFNFDRGQMTSVSVLYENNMSQDCAYASTNTV